MDDFEARALARIAEETNADTLLAYAGNAQGKSPVVERAALRRLAQVSAKYDVGTVENACWAMVHTVEATRRLKGRKVARMNRMRPKIEKDGEISALEYCALNETEGFAEVMAYGMPELTAEAIVLRYASQFSAAARTAARRRLTEVGVDIDEQGQIRG